MARLGLAGSVLRNGRFVLAATAALVAATGCENPTVPVATAGAGKGAAAKRGLKSLELIPGPVSRADLEVIKGAARVQAGLDTLRVQTADVPPDAGPGVQAGLVRQAIDREPPVIIVEAPAVPDADLARAAGEARAKGIPVIVLGKPLGEGASAGGPGREILVAPRPFRESADPIVATAVRNAQTGKVDPKGGAVILSYAKGDALAPERIEALKAALKDAGVAEVGEVRVEGVPEADAARFAAYLAEHPAATIALGIDAVGVGVAKAGFDAKHPFVVAGYSADEGDAKTQTQMGEYAAVGVYAPDRLIRKGVSTASHIIRGDKVADRIEIETAVHASPAQSGTPRGPVERAGRPGGPGEE